MSQTEWAETIACALADAGVSTCVISPGSRSTPLVAALATESRLEVVPIIDERAAAFFALGVARATGVPTAIACTSGSAAAHYLPAIVEASEAGVPIIALTADRPPELHDAGANQTIDQVRLYGSLARGFFDVGAPVAGELAMRAVRRKIVQAVTMARGPRPGPVHVNLPFRKPLEPVATESGRAIREPVITRPARLVADHGAIAAMVAAIANEPNGMIVAGAMPPAFAGSRESVFELARRTGYPLAAEAGSQLRFGERNGVIGIDHADLARGPKPAMIVQLGCEPVNPAFAGVPRWVIAETWRDPESTATVVLGDVGATIAAVVTMLPPATRASRSAGFAEAWIAAEHAAATAIDGALAAHPRSEGAVIRAAIASAMPRAVLQIGNSLPIRVVDHVCSGGPARVVITQRGASGIDGLVASAAGATRAGHPVLLVLGDVSFAHDVGGLIAARAASTPLAIVVIDNGGGQIFAGLPIAKTALPTFTRDFTTPPGIDPVAVATAFGARGVLAESPSAVAAAVATALETPGVTVIHAPVSPSGARDVLELARRI
jgi:2-succinyl-5-enolpyruvyl-6-hydroxy-3-cyclohexene-1-carboxylate synthase